MDVLTILILGRALFAWIFRHQKEGQDILLGGLWAVDFFNHIRVCGHVPL